MATDLHDLSIAELSAPDRGAQAVARGAGRGADPARRAVRRPDARVHHAARSTWRGGRPGRPRPRSRRAARAGPLHGIPFGLKDIYDTRGILTSAHSRVFIDRIPAEDATATTQALRRRRRAARQAGHPRDGARRARRSTCRGRPRAIPWNLAHFTGGSSTGLGRGRRGRPGAGGARLRHRRLDPRARRRSAASSASMPTFGLVSRAGVITNSYTFDHCGPLARTVEDCALMLQALAGYDPKDAGSLRRPIPRYRAALGAGPARARASACSATTGRRTSRRRTTCAQAMDAALDVLRRLGAELEECRVRPLGELLRRQDHHRGERDLQRASARPDRAARATSAPTSAPARSPPCSSPPTTTSRPRASTAA